MGQRAVDLCELLAAVRETWGKPSAIGCDRWKEWDLKDALAKVRFPVVPFITRGQGYKDGSADVSSFRRALLEEALKPVPSLLLRAVLAGARVVSDPAGNVKLTKASEGGRRLRHRDDAAAASVFAVAVGYREARRRGFRKAN